MGLIQSVERPCRQTLRFPRDKDDLCDENKLHSKERNETKSEVWTMDGEKGRNESSLAERMGKDRKFYSHQKIEMMISIQK